MLKKIPRVELPAIDQANLDALGPFDDSWLDRFRWLGRIRFGIQSLKEVPDDDIELGINLAEPLGIIWNGLKKHQTLFPLFEKDVSDLIQRFRACGPIDHPGDYLCRDGILDNRGWVLQLISIRDLYQTARSGQASRAAARRNRPSRRNPFLMRYLKDRIRKNSKLTKEALWEELKKYYEDCPLKIKSPKDRPGTGGSIWFKKAPSLTDSNRGDLIISSPSMEKELRMPRKKFNEYFAACKNPPTRAK